MAAAGGQQPEGLPGGAGGAPGGTQQQQQQQQQQMQEKRKKEEEARADILAQILLPDARERIHRLSLVKPEKARGVEQYILGMAKSGQLRGRVDDKGLKAILESIAETEGKKRTSSITIQRKGELAQSMSALEREAAEAAADSDSDSDWD